MLSREDTNRTHFEEWKDLYAAAGWVAAQAALAEACIADLVIDLIGGRHVALLVRGQPIGQHLQMLGALRLVLDDQALCEQVARVERRAVVLGEQRAQVVHGLWDPPVDSAGPLTATLAKRWGKESLGQWTVESVWQLGMDFLDLAEDAVAAAAHVTRQNGDRGLE